MEIAPLVDDRIDGDGRFSGLAVADDQFALPAADRNHGIDGLETGLQWLVDGLAEDDARSLAFERHFDRRAFDRAFPVKGFAKRCDDTSQQGFVYMDGGHVARPPHGISLLDEVGGAEQYGTDVVLFEIHYDGLHAVVEFEQFVGFGVSESVDAHDAVADLQHRPYFGILRRQIGILQLGKQRFRHFGRFDIVCFHGFIRFCRAFP